MIVNFVRVSRGRGYYKLEKVREIGWEYIKSKFGIDMMCWMGLVIDITLEFQLSSLLRIVFFFKLYDCMEKIEAL